MLAVVGTRHLSWDQSSANETVTRSQQSRRIRRTRYSPVNRHVPLVSLFPWAAITALFLITLAYDLISNRYGTTNAIEVIGRSLFSGLHDSPGALFLLSATWVVASVVGLSEELKEICPRESMRLIVCFALLSLIGPAVFITFQAFLLTRPGNASDTVLNLLVLYFAGTLLVIITLAANLFSGESGTHTKAFALSRKSIAAVPILAMTLIVVLYSTNFAVVWADTLAKLGNGYGDATSWDESINAYTRALALEPNQDSYKIDLGQTYLKKARAISESTTRSQTLNSSDQAFQDAQKLNPFSMEPSANLGQLHRIWATLVDDQASKSVHLHKSSEYFQVTIRLNPNMPYFRNELSLTYLQRGDWKSAQAQLEKSLELDPNFAQTFYYLGEYYRGLQNADQAVENYTRAIILDPETLSDANGKPFAGPMSIFTRREYLTRTIETYRAAAIRFPNSVAVRNALISIGIEPEK